jgi:4-hydroxythreonine-4-phosphate dehydrogenase
MSFSLAVSLGDPAGVGPELILKAWLAREAERLPPFFVVEGAEILEQAAAHLGLDCPIVRIGGSFESSESFASGLPVWRESKRTYLPGQPDGAGARLAWKSLCNAIGLTKDVVRGIVTGPVSKSAIDAIAPGFVGQTEALADSFQIPRDHAVMMLAGPSLRTVPMTVHCPLSEVPGRLSSKLIASRIRIVDRSLRNDFGIASPRIAVCGLNPHAGEDGRMGREEIDIIAPAIAALQQDGIDATGPHPADTLFAPHKRGSYDVAIAMYHDQALVPLKALDFDQGVNVTLGLPIVRTSPDHGTAFDIAGKGVASPGAMIAAIRMAGEMVARRGAHPSTGSG